MWNFRSVPTTFWAVVRFDFNGGSNESKRAIHPSILKSREDVWWTGKLAEEVNAFVLMRQIEVIPNRRVDEFLTLRF